MEGTPLARTRARHTKNLPRLAVGRGEATRETASKVQARRELRKGQGRGGQGHFLAGVTHTRGWVKR